MKCKYELCDSYDIQGLGYCQKHYLRYKNGTLNLREELGSILYLGEDIDSQIYKPVTYEVDENGCWNINSHVKDKDGYGSFKRIVNGSLYRRVHRASYAYYNGDLNADELVRHTCNNPSCINPEHLKKGSHYDNMQDRKASGNYIRNHGKRKLTKEQVLEAVKLNKEGIQVTKIAESLDINVHTLRDVLKGRTWSHVTGIEYNPKSRKFKST